MKSRLARIGLLFVTSALVLLVGTRANAVQINTSGTICQAFNAGQVADIDYLSTGVRNLNISPRAVVCSIQRQAPGTAVNTTFTVAGVNPSGALTAGTVYAYGPDGSIRGSQSFSSTAAFYSIPLTFPAAQMTFFTLNSAVITLPGTSSSVFTGVIVAP
jgi:hypothetical protein